MSMKNSGFKERTKYAKILIKSKVKFLRKVVLDGLSIKDVELILLSRPQSLTSIIPRPRPSFVNTDPNNSNTICNFHRKIKPKWLTRNLGWDVATGIFQKTMRWNVSHRQMDIRFSNSKEKNRRRRKRLKFSVRRGIKSLLSQFSTLSSRSSAQYLTIEDGPSIYTPNHTHSFSLFKTTFLKIQYQIKIESILTIILSPSTVWGLLSFDSSIVCLFQVKKKYFVFSDCRNQFIFLKLLNFNLTVQWSPNEVEWWRVDVQL